MISIGREQEGPSSKERYEELKATIEADVWPEDPGECVEWKYNCLPSGAGKVLVGNMPHVVHRLAYTLAGGVLDGVTVKNPNPNPKFGESAYVRLLPSWGARPVVHTCENLGCYRPSHLKLGEVEQ